LNVELHVAADESAAARATAELLADAAARGGHVALAGGSTPRAAYERAAVLRSDWHLVELWWGDERCVPSGDVRSNYRLARVSLLDGLARLPAVHRVRTELGCERAAAAYDEELDGVRFSFVLLGLGADGHTASLFPGSTALDERARDADAARLRRSRDARLPRGRSR
jgi:6-phosphogluconolactonase